MAGDLMLSSWRWGPHVCLAPTLPLHYKRRSPLLIPHTTTTKTTTFLWRCSTPLHGKALPRLVLRVGRGRGRERGSSSEECWVQHSTSDMYLYRCWLPPVWVSIFFIPVLHSIYTWVRSFLLLASSSLLCIYTKCRSLLQGSKCS